MHQGSHGFVWNCNFEQFATCGVIGENLNCVGNGNCLMKRETKQTFVSCSHVLLGFELEQLVLAQAG